MGDFEFKNLYVSVTRSLVDQHVGPVKTEASRKLMPIDEYVAHDLLAWYDLTPYKKASDYVWATCDLSTRCSSSQTLRTPSPQERCESVNRL
jgi:hypothetical protein